MQTHLDPARWFMVSLAHSGQSSAIGTRQANGGKERERRCSQFVRRLRLEQLEARIPLAASISGTVWEDLNGNAVRDYGEMGMAGVPVFLDSNDNGVCDAGEPTTLSAPDNPITDGADETGTYEFGNLTPGIHLVRQVVAEELASFPDPQSPLVVWEQLADTGLDWQGNRITGLDGVRGAVLSPDSQHLYVAAWHSSAVTVFRRDLATGHLTFVESLRDAGQDGTGQTIDGLWGALPIVVSASGEHVYVGGRYDNAVAWFQRDPDTGRLTFRGRVKDGQQDATGKFVDGLDGVASVTLSPDGSQVYATGYDEDAVAVFARDAGTGGLTFVATYKDGQVLGGGQTLDGLDGAWSVVASGDGQHVYVNGLLDDTVVVFSRHQTTGELTWIETLRDLQPDANGGVVQGLDGSYSTTLTPDGTEAFVTSAADAIARFARNPATGRLTFWEAIDNSDEAVELDYPRSAVLAPNGEELYVPAANALLTFSRDPLTERVRFEQVLRDGGHDGQGQLVERLDTAFAAAVTADGRFVYVTAYAGDAVSVYYRPRHPGAHAVDVRAGQSYSNRDFGRRATTGNRILYILTEYPDRPANAAETVARHWMSVVNDYYIRNSYGKWSYPHITFTPPLMMPHDLAWYDPDNSTQGLAAMWSDALSAAEAAGYDTAAGYDPTVNRHNILYYDSPVYAGRGVATIGGTRIRITTVQAVRVTVHEMAHNLSIRHSNYWDTGGTSVIGPGTLVSDNPFEPMGAAVLGDLLLYEKKRLGWLSDAQIPQVTSSGVYTIQAMDRGVAHEDQDYGLWIARTDGKEYWLEFRQGEASNEWSEDGVVVYWKNVLLDMTPGSPDGIDDSPLLIGKTFSDSEAGIHITPVAKQDSFPESVDVVVNLGQFPNNQPPQASFSATRRVAFVGETIIFRDESVDPDQHDLANFWTFGDGTWQTNRPVAAKAWSQPGQHKVQVEVTDMHGGTALFEDTITIEIPPGPYLRLQTDAASIREDSGPAAATVTVLRGNADTSQPLDVILRSSDASELTVPASVTIPADEDAINVPISAVDDSLLDGTQTVWIEAEAAGYLTDSLGIGVLDAESLAIRFDSQQVAEDGGSVSATVTRGNLDVSQPLLVQLTSSDSTEATVPTSVTIPANQASVSFVITAVDDTLLDGTQTVAITATADGYTSASDTIEVSDQEPQRVAEWCQTGTGFTARFSDHMEPNVLNLYDGPGGLLGSPDVVVRDSAGHAVAGSLVVSGDAQTITWIAAGGILPPAEYTATLRSGIAAFHDLEGNALDGDANGVSGGDYQTTFVVTAPPPDAVTVSLPDFTRGPGQVIHVPAGGNTGIPLTLSDGANVQDVDLRLAFDPSLLDITGAAVASGLPSGAQVSFSVERPGLVRLQFHSPMPLGAGAATLVRLQSTVPDAAPYGASHLLDLHDLLVNAGSLPALDDDAVHLAAFFGDTTGNGSYSGLDAQRIARVVVGLDSGFEASATVAPTIIADITGNGDLSGLDAVLVAREVVGLDPPEIPPMGPFPSPPLAPESHAGGTASAELPSPSSPPAGDDDSPDESLRELVIEDTSPAFRDQPARVLAAEGQTSFQTSALGGSPADARKSLARSEDAADFRTWERPQQFRLMPPTSPPGGAHLLIMSVRNPARGMLRIKQDPHLGDSLVDVLGKALDGDLPWDELARDVAINGYSRRR